MNKDVIPEEIYDLMDSGHDGYAADLLRLFLRDNPNHGKGWFYLYFCVTTREQKIDALKHLLVIDPKYPSAKSRLNKLLEQQEIEDKRTQSNHFGKEIEPVYKKSEAIESHVSTPEEKTKLTSHNQTQKTQINKGPRPYGLEYKNKKGEINSLHKEPSTIGKKVQTPKGKVQATKNNRASIAEQKAETKRPATARSPSKEDRDAAEIMMPIKPPTVIVVKPEDNYFEYKWVSRIFHDSSGLIGKTIFIDGIRITPQDMPICLKIGGIPRHCEICDFYSPDDCPIQDDSYLLEELRRFFIDRQQHLQQKRRYYEVRRRLIYSELRAHGRPLHYTVIAKMVIHRYPKFRFTESQILRLLTRNPGLFERVDSGVYSCRKKRRKY